MLAAALRQGSRRRSTPSSCHGAPLSMCEESRRLEQLSSPFWNVPFSHKDPLDTKKMAFKEGHFRK